MLGTFFNKSTPGLYPNTHIFKNGEAAWALHENHWHRVRITGAYAPTKRGETMQYSVWHWKLDDDFGKLTTESGALAPDDVEMRLWLRESVGRDGVVKTDWAAMGN